MIVGVCRVTVLVTYAHSLKEKRGAIRKMKDRVRNKFALELAEVGGLDTWQRAVLGFAVVSSDRDYTESLIESVIRFIEGMGLGELASDERDVLTYGADS